VDLGALRRYNVCRRRIATENGGFVTGRTSEVSRPFIGRDREMRSLVEGLDDVLVGRGRLFLVAGEPGIGKSRLADEFTAVARDRGAHVFWGRCWEAGGAPPYWPWVQILRAYVRTRDPDQIRGEIGPGAVDVAQILPELRQMFPELPEPPPVDPESARFQLFDSTATFVANASGAEPLVFVLEDLHAADEPSLLLLRFVSAQISGARILVIGTYRDVELTPSHPLTAAAAEVGRDPATRHIALRGLSEEDVERFVVTAAGTPPPGLAAALHRETSGNPLFLGEAVKLLVDEGELERLTDPARLRVAVPQSVREVIGRRIEHLDEQSREVLTLASVLGTEFAGEDLRRLSGIAPDAFHDLLDRLTEAGIVAPAPGGLGRFRFSHELIRETLYRALTSTNRMRLHLRAAEILASSSASGGDSHLAGLAHHYFEAAPLGDVATAVDFARRAGDEAALSLAYEEASRLYGIAVQALELEPDPDQETLGGILLSLGEAQAQGGNLPAARESYLRVATSARRSGDAVQLAHAGLGYGGRFPWARAGDDPHLIPMLQDALMLLGGDDERLRVRLLSRLSCALRSSPDRERSDSLSRQAVDVARSLGDASTLSFALSCRVWSIWWPENPAERLELATELIGMGDEAEPERLFEGHVARSAFLLDLGRVAEAYAEWESMARRARELRTPAQTWPVRTWQTLFSLMAGDLRRTEVLLESEAPAGQMWTTVRDEASAVQMHRFLLLREIGGLEDIEAATRSAVDEFPWYPCHRAALACLLIELDREREARAVFDELAADGFRIFYRDCEWLFGMAMAADACARLQDIGAASELYEELAPFAGAHAIALAEGSAGIMDRYLGLLAWRLGRWEEVDRHFEQAVALNERMAATPWAAHSRHDWARALLHRDAPGDRERAMHLLSEARRTAGELGMVILENRIQEALAGVGGERQPTRDGVRGHPSVFRREGEYWSISFDGQSFRLRDSKGLRYLALLLAAPGREVHALELVGSDQGSGAARPEGLTVVEDDAGVILDPEAKAAYRRRIAELETEVQEAREWSDPARAEKAEQELEFLVNELAGAVGLGGRDRKAGSAAERARVNVTRAIRAALDRVEEHSPDLGRHLLSTIRTGVYCSYAPDPRVPTAWQL
jgi:tetratricopeptide (TPR) repeat protein